MANLKIFKVDDYSWYVAHNLMEFLNWYHKNVNSIETEEDLQQLEITEPRTVTCGAIRILLRRTLKS